MKFLSLLFVVFLFMGTISAKEIKDTQVPVEIKQPVNKNYPDVRWIEWDYNKKKKIYKASFFIDGRQYELAISSTGTLLFSKINIFTEEIPEFAFDYVNQHHRGAEVIGGYRYLSEIDGNYYRIDAVMFRKGGKIKRYKFYFNDQAEIVNMTEK